MDKTLRETQYRMHKNYFDRAKDAIDNEYYLEAIFLEYAAIEGRLEVILGILGCPCNKDIERQKRTKINISHRVNCLKRIMKTTELLGNSKLDKDFFKSVDDWIRQRNTYIHGLYKNGMEYVNRTEYAKVIADSGLKISKSFYNEANRLKRLLKKNEVECIDIDCMRCYSKKCSLYNVDKEE